MSGLPHPRGRRRPSKRVAEWLLVVTAVMGILSLVWVAASMLFGLSLVVFKTGSMSPTMPTGTVAIEQNVQAKDIDAGDVVTVRRPGAELPITHRVVSIASMSGGPTRSLTLQGDGNSMPDTEPYEVQSARRVLVWMPGAANVLAVLTLPAVLGLLVMLVGLALAWTLWPTKPQPTATATVTQRHERTPTGRSVA